MSFGKTITLAHSVEVLQIRLHTWLSNAVEIAVCNGYCHLDLVMVYQNQDEVGASLKKVIPSIMKHEELFITSKLWNSAHQPNKVEKELDKTLKQLGLDYLDLYFIHWPIVFAPGWGLFPAHPMIPGQVDIDNTVTLADMWKAMIKLPKSKVWAIGVSNFTVEHLKGIIDTTGVVPIVNQVKAHPLLLQDDLS